MFSNLLAGRGKKFAGMAGLALTGVALSKALESLLPGAGEGSVHATSTLAGMLAVCSPQIKEFVMHLFNHHCSVHASETANENDAQRRDHEFEDQREFNHDLEKAFGRSLCKVLGEWADTQAEGARAGEKGALPEIVVDHFRELSVRVEQIENSVPRWVTAAQAVDVSINEQMLRDLCLNGGIATAGSEFLSKTEWAEFFIKLSDGLKNSPAFKHYSSLWSASLCKFLNERFPFQFYNDIKSAFSDPRHSKAWAAMQIRIDAFIIQEVKGESRETRDSIARLEVQADGHARRLESEFSDLQGLLEQTLDAVKKGFSEFAAQAAKDHAQVMAGLELSRTAAERQATDLAALRAELRAAVLLPQVGIDGRMLPSVGTPKDVDGAIDELRSALDRDAFVEALRDMTGAKATAAIDQLIETVADKPATSSRRARPSCGDRRERWSSKQTRLRRYLLSNKPWNSIRLIVLHGEARL